MRAQFVAVISDTVFYVYLLMYHCNILATLSYALICCTVLQVG